jgi:O-antigen/teichoic acid export membrane protein
VNLPRVLNGRLVRSALVVLSGTAVFQIVLLASSPILSRLYDPDDFGVLSVFSSLMTLLLVVSSLRYEQAVALPSSPARAANITAVSALAVAVTTAIASGVLLALGSRLGDVSDTPKLTDVMWIFPLALAGAATQQLLIYVAVRRGAFRSVSMNRAVQGIVMVGVQIALGVAGAGAGGLVGGFVAGLVIAAVLLVWWDRGLVSRWRTEVSWSAMRSEARRYRRFPQFGVWSGLFNRGALDLPNLLFAAIYGPAVAGYFLLSQRVVAAPTQLIGQSVGHVYFNEAAVAARERRDELPSLYRRVVRRLMAVGVAPAIGLAVLGPWVFALVFGSDWREAGVYAALMAPLFLAQLAITPLTSTFAIAERQDLQFIRDLIRLVFVVAVFVAGWRFDLSARWTVAGYSAAMVAGYVLLWFFGWREVRAFARTGPRPDALVTAGDEP